MGCFNREELHRKRIGVLLGGLSAERDVSLKTGQAALEALWDLGYEAEAVDARTDLAAELVKRHIDVAFIALHGRFGEDGRVQGLLELMQIPYTGSGVMSSGIAIDKIMTKQLLHQHQLLTPGFSYVRPGQASAPLVEYCCARLPQVIKPAREGSTIGISIVKQAAEVSSAVAEAVALDGAVLAEDFIDGDELTVSVVDGKAMPIIKIVPEGGFYDYQAKYHSTQTRYLVPAPIDAQLTEQIQRAAEGAYHALACRGAARVDFMLKEQDFYCIEVNTIPGMTKTSLLPKAAAASGINFNQLVEMILLDADLDK